MEALSLSSSISVRPNMAINFELVKGKKNSLVYCQSGNYGRKSLGISSTVLTETSAALITQDHMPPLMETGSFVLSPNGKDLDSGFDDGIGIVKFLRGKALFITGATGFLGKVLIEKILRTAPDVHKIFVLIKAKNEKAAAERLKNEIINAELFTRLKQIHGKSYQAFMLSKLIPVVGNVCKVILA